MSKQKEEEKIFLKKLSKALVEKDYQYEMPLGKGSYGLVVKAKHLGDEKNTYAIKCISTQTPKYRERELNILQEKGIVHENIVKFFQEWFINIDKSQFLCIPMECCRVNLESFIYNNKMGGAEIITSQGSPRLYQHVFPQILKGLHAIHDIGWVHRDIHPRNILIAYPDPDEIRDIIVKIADFGLARKIRSRNGESLLTDGSKLQKLSTDVGNKDFRAPELDDGDYDYKVDLYSAGIVLYFLSRYLEVQGQWKDEIKAFICGKRGSEDLFHQDKHLIRLIQLLMQEREKRPSAKEALKIAEKPAESPEHDQSQILVEPKKLHFLAKKDDERAYNRCWIKVTILTLSNLKAKVEQCTGIKADSQELCQKTEDAGLINITSDENVEHIFEEKKSVYIIASTKIENRDEKKFRVKKKGESTWIRCSTRDNTLSSLNVEIQNCLGVRAESQKLAQQQTTASGKDRIIEITCDKHVEEMFKSAEGTRDPVEIVVSDMNEASMDETKTFFITKSSETVAKRGSIKEFSLSSLKEEITRNTGVPTDLQALYQLKTIHNIQQWVDIKCDKDVDDMFRSAEKGNPVNIVVSENMPVSESENQTDAGNDEEKTFLIKTNGPCHPSTRIRIKRDALNLSCLQEELEKTTNIERNSQILYEKTIVHGQPELIAIKTDQDVQMMGKNGEESVVFVSNASSESLDFYR